MKPESDHTSVVFRRNLEYLPALGVAHLAWLSPGWSKSPGWHSIINSWICSESNRGAKAVRHAALTLDDTYQTLKCSSRLCSDPSLVQDLFRPNCCSLEPRSAYSVTLPLAHNCACHKPTYASGASEPLVQDSRQPLLTF